MLYKSISPHGHNSVEAASEAKIKRHEFAEMQANKTPFESVHDQDGLKIRSSIIKELSYANFLAVNERYPGSPIDVESYRIQTISRCITQLIFPEWDWLTILDCIDCYEYQTKDYSSWEKCRAFNYISELRKNVIEVHIMTMRADRECCWGNPKYVFKSHLRNLPLNF